MRLELGQYLTSSFWKSNPRERIDFGKKLAKKFNEENDSINELAVIVDNETYKGKIIISNGLNKFHVPINSPPGIFFSYPVGTLGYIPRTKIGGDDVFLQDENALPFTPIHGGTDDFEKMTYIEVNKFRIEITKESYNPKIIIRNAENKRKLFVIEHNGNVTVSGNLSVKGGIKALMDIETDSSIKANVDVETSTAKLNETKLKADTHTHGWSGYGSGTTTPPM